MLFPKVERAKRRNPGLATLLDELVIYIRSQLDEWQEFIVSKLAAVSLKITDGEAFVLLKILSEADVLEMIYNVYCSITGALIATVESLDALDDISCCDTCSREHDISDLTVEIAFRGHD
jgi:hypothetical protein